MPANNAFTVLMMSLEKIAKVNSKYRLALLGLYKDGVDFCTLLYSQFGNSAIPVVSIFARMQEPIDVRINRAILTRILTFGLVIALI